MGTLQVKKILVTTRDRYDPLETSSKISNYLIEGNTQVTFQPVLPTCSHKTVRKEGRVSFTYLQDKSWHHCTQVALQFTNDNGGNKKRPTVPAFKDALWPLFRKRYRPFFAFVRIRTHDTLYLVQKGRRLTVTVF